MKDQLPLLSYAVVRHLLVVVGIYRHLVVLSIIILGILQLPLEGNTVGAPQEIVAEEAKPDSIATELIDRIQSLEVAPAPADTKKIAIHGSVYTPSLSPARGIVACWSLEKDGTAATFLGKIDTNIRGQFSIEIVTTVKPTSTLHIIAISFNHGIGWTQCNTTELATKRSHSIMLHDGSGSIEGTLLAPGNKPVAGFELSVHDIFEDQGGGISTNYFPIQYSTKSDDNGHFVIEGLPSKVYVLLNIQSKELISKQTIMPTSPGIPSPQSGTNQIKTIASGTEIKLFPRVELTGNVVDALGQPITDARIIASFSRAVTDEEGKYTLVRPDVSAWSVAEAATYVEQLIVQPPEKSRFVETILYVNPGHFSERTIKPCILKGEFPAIPSRAAGIA